MTTEEIQAQLCESIKRESERLFMLKRTLDLADVLEIIQPYMDAERQARERAERERDEARTRLLTAAGDDLCRAGGQ